MAGQLYDEGPPRQKPSLSLAASRLVHRSPPHSRLAAFFFRFRSARRSAVRRCAPTLLKAAIIVLDIATFAFFVFAFRERQGGRFRFQQTLASNNESGFTRVVAKFQFHCAIRMRAPRHLATSIKQRSPSMPPVFPFFHAGTSISHSHVTHPPEQQQYKKPRQNGHFPSRHRTRIRMQSYMIAFPRKRLVAHERRTG